MGYIITKDNVHTEPAEIAYKKTGKTYGNYKGGKNKFRVCDDDGEIYFYGFSDCGSSFAPLDNFGAAWGCTYIEYKNPKTKIYEEL